MNRHHTWVCRACGFVSEMELPEDTVAPFTIKCQSCRAPLAEKRPDPWTRWRVAS